MSKLAFSTETFTCHLTCTQCTTIRANGERCRRTVCIGTPTCWQHSMIDYGVKTRLSTIPGAGIGLFAVRIIYEGELIVPYDGENITRECLDMRYPNDGTGPYSVAAADNIIKDAACQRSLGSMANGLFENGASLPEDHHNAIIIENNEGLWLRATKDIEEDEEIFVFYGPEYQFNEHNTKRTRVPDNRPC